MRNAVLSVMGELLVQQLSESTDEAVKETRDHYLDVLEVLSQQCVDYLLIL